jgi:hypothetical protein
MLVLLTFGLYGLTLLAIGILRLTRRPFSYAWLAAALGALLAWVSIFAWQSRLPALVHLNSWQSASLFSSWPLLVVDEVAWVYALALSALALAVILAAPAQATGVSLSAWVGTLGLTGMGMLAVLSANPLTLVMVWTGLDLLELTNTLRLVRKPDLSERVVVSFAVRALGTGFALWAIVTNGVVLPSFEAISPQSALFLFLAAGLRLGVLPLHLSYRNEPALRRGMGTVLRMAAASSSLVLLARLPGGLFAPETVAILQVFLTLAFLYAAWKWLGAPGELPARPYWIVGLGALSLLASLRGNPAGSVAWGAALVLCGGVVFLYSSRQRGLTAFLSALVLGMFSLPLSLTAVTWDGAAAFDGWFWPFLVAGQSLLAIGFVRHLWRTSESELENMPRWAQSAYPLGLFVLAATILLLGLWGWSGAMQVGLWPVGAAVAAVTLVALAAWWRISRFGTLAQDAQDENRPAVTELSVPSRLTRFLEWLASLLWGFYRSLRRLVDFFSGLLEGDGGLLWTVLVLILLLIWFQQISM